MSAPSNKSSRWGSFLSQAVAGVEARLDTILADEDASAPARESKQAPSAAPVVAVAPTSTPAPTPSPVPAPSRTASTNRINDRLQERLARAMAAKSAGQKTDGRVSAQASPRQSIDAPSRGSMESMDRSSPGLKEAPAEVPSVRSSQEVARKPQEAAAPAAEEPSIPQSAPDQQKEPKEPGEDINGVKTSTDQPPAATNHTETVPTIETSIEPAPEPDSPHASEDVSDEERRARELQKTLEDTQLQHQEEVHGYVERIDALEAKLQFLAREATDSARKAVLAAPAGSAEKKLAEKDQQIAQLMEEGKNLASTEQKHRTILKKLRAKIAEDERELNSLKAAKDKSNRELDNLRRRARQADELEKAHDDLQKRFEQSQRELNALRPEVKSKEGTIAELRTQLQKVTEHADAMSTKVNDQARAQDRRRIAELEEAVAALQVEKNLVADRAKIQATELREKAERATERSRALELELKAEVQVMESKLEAMRTRAEEASSGAIGDSQAKLLRQVETLQTQYSIASENWQGIETTLLGRIASLEKERDDALQRESDMRRKAREAAVRARRNEEELEMARSTTLPNIEEDVRSYRAQLDALKKRAEEAEAALANARAEFEKQKQLWEAEKEDKHSRQPGDRRSWLEDLPNAPFLKSDSRPASPQLFAPQRTFSTDFLGIQSITNKVRKASAPSSNSDAGAGPDNGKGFSRRPSAQPLVRPTGGQSGGGSLFSPSVSALSPTMDLHTPLSSTHPLDREPLHRSDTFDSMDTTSSPHQVLQDMVSVSTVAAGPSVQLVERMSAAIRRLESEKVAARAELARISKQRDEARAEIVALMRESEGGKTAQKRVAELEAEVAEVNARYETTLEMLGEKSELVEELMADVQDVKAMYRDLVERTIT
ncbi:TATA element modulatory factor 1 TATA binding-domain-containing protein [Cercophora scortea]|uniref:TATA element modulatory factor 1 TATA binding-domain-containing protein n=1 Tax=Cercophora scortea TaxID=314031 RepID=A0AAE0MK57_9PEZI|nr:TATA element modulatory factor 1 TATA binding-domain-containing protein [Cercophora scortea]